MEQLRVRLIMNASHYRYFIIFHISLLILLVGDSGEAVINRYVSIATKKLTFNLLHHFLLFLAQFLVSILHSKHSMTLLFVALNGP